MFYAQFVLSKKGPLAKIWLAAHWEKKLSKAQIYETNVQDAVDEILKPKIKMALRTTGHLLLGIVRIYSRKAKYLLADCNEAFMKIKMAFRPGQVDLPEDGREAQLNAITLPEVFHDFDAALPDFNDLEMQTQLQVNQSRIDDITLKEDVPEASRPFGADFGTDDFGENALGMFGDDEAIEDARAGSLSMGPSMLGSHGYDASRLAADDFYTGGDVPGAIPDDFGDFAPEHMLDDVVFNENELARGMESIEAPGADQEMPMESVESEMQSSFALEPLDAAMLEKSRPAQRRRRRLLVDEQKNIGGDEMKANMADYRDTLQIYQSHLVLKGRDSGSISAMEIRRDLEMQDLLADIHEDRSSILQEDRDEYDDGAGGHSPSPTAGNHVDEDGGDVRSPRGNAITSPNKDSPEKKKERKSRASAVDKDEDDGEGGDEDHRWTKRTQAQLNTIAAKLKASDGDPIVLSDMLTKNATRKSAAQKFYTLLVLTKWQAISVDQDEPYGEIQISAGPHIAQYTTAAN